jgi:valyl-tRNA synthetase
MMNTEALAGRPLVDFEAGPAERWITSRVQQVSGEVHKSMEAYRFDQVVQTLHAFTWDEYCSWYLEIAKIQLSDPELSDTRKDGVRQTLVNLLDSALRLIHPIMPFITEALWQQLQSRTICQGQSIMRQAYPKMDEALIDDAAVEDLDWVRAVVSGIRNIRGEMNIGPKVSFPVTLQGGDAKDRKRCESFRGLLIALARLDRVEHISKDTEETEEHATALVGDMKVLVPLGSIIDRDAEIQRLSREVEKLTTDLKRCEGKLSNPKFVDRAPADVVEKEQGRAEQITRDLEELRSRQQRIAALN